MWCMATYSNTGAPALICSHFKNERLRSADLGGSWEVTALISANMCSAICCTVYAFNDLEHKNWTAGSLLTGELYSFTIWANTDESTVLLNSECVVSPSKTVLPIAPPSSGLTTVNHCVHTHRQVAKNVISIFLRKEESLCMLNNDVTEYKSLFKSTFSIIRLTIKKMKAIFILNVNSTLLW